MILALAATNVLRARLAAIVQWSSVRQENFASEDLLLTQQRFNVLLALMLPSPKRCRNKTVCHVHPATIAPNLQATKK